MALPSISRRNLLVGGGVGAGLVVGFALWPRAYAPGLNTVPGEHALSGLVKVGEDGHVTIVVPQVELGNGVLTGQAQIVADELGADWRTVAVETARPGRLGANTLLAREWAAGTAEAPPDWLVDMRAERAGFVATGGSTSIRGFEARLRDAGAAARALLCTAAAARWDADWEACDTHDGFVWHGDERMRFGEVAAAAARAKLPDSIVWRTGREHRLVAQELPRLDVPAKIDGSMNYAGDIRLPDMVYAAIAEGPVGDARLKRFDRAAAMRIPGVIEVVEQPRWIAVAAANSWAALQGLRATAAVFAGGAFPDDRSIDHALDAAFHDGGTRQSALGDIGAAFKGATVFTQSYRAAPALHVTVETASATAAVRDGRIEVWVATQVPALTAAAIGRATSRATADVIVHPMMVGGSFGARYETGIAEAASILADKLKRPVQLTRSREEETRRDAMRAPAAARMAARVEPDGRIAAWHAQIATPSALGELRARIEGGKAPHEAIAAMAAISEPAAIAGAVPPYDIPVHAIDHHPASTDLPAGDWRGGASGPNVFFRECFVDELAHMTGSEPFGVRMAMLGGAPRLAQCLTRVAANAGWQGGVPGTNQGLACHMMAGSFIAVVAEARRDGAGVGVERIWAVADIGRIVNPGIVRGQIMGGLVFGMSAATGAPPRISRGIIGPARLGTLRLPRLTSSPKIEIELVISSEPSGGVGELAVPPAAPAIAGALFAATGVRYRRLPLLQDN